MKTLTTGFVLTAADDEARAITPGRTLTAQSLPPRFRWWLVTGGLVHAGVRPRPPNPSPAHPPTTPRA